ncbi:MAG TPA: amidohydrolase, partial [Planctomycetaceae bacterium]|nr:amidohydrolase [Planctomycetaceae bacterium]
MSRLPALSRRDWLAVAVSGLAAAALPGRRSSAVAEAPTMPLAVIDTHQHLWDLKKFTLPWHQVEDVGVLRKSFVMSDYL